MSTVILSVQYKGTAYAGYQIQKNLLTVQGELESTIAKVCKKYYTIHPAGRTDSGVHANSQFVSFTVGDEFTLPHNKIGLAINSKLPFDIRVNYAKVYNGRFHARFDALHREYIYLLSTEFNVFQKDLVSFIKFPINRDILFESADIFLKKADFTTYSKLNPDNINPVCNVTICEWEYLSENLFKLTVKSNHFLYGMVRSIVGAMIDIARGKRERDEVIESFNKKDRLLNSPLAPPQGLYLNRVFYHEKFGLF